MKFYPVEPRSQEWYQRRLGLPTSSNFDMLLTPKTLKPSTQAEKLLFGLLAEWYLGHQLDSFESQWMIRGQELEDDAYRRLEFDMDIETTLGGFFTDDAGRYGCSPDRLIGTDGVLELKCHNAAILIGCLLNDDLDDAHKMQIAGQLLVTEREYVLIAAYHPELPLYTKKVGRDEKTIGLLATALDTFCEQLARAKEILISKYGEPKRPEPASEPPIGNLGISDDDADAILADLREKGAL